MSDASVRHIPWESIPKEELNPLLQRRLITGEKGMLAHVYLAKGAVVPQRRWDQDPTMAIELALNRRRHVATPQQHRVAIPLRQLRDLLLKRLPLSERIDVEAQIRQGGRNHQTAVLSSEHMAKARGEARATLRVNRVLVMAPEHALSCLLGGDA